MGRVIRTGLLLLAITLMLANVVVSYTRTPDWQRTLLVVIYPLNADDRPHTEAYIDQLSQRNFTDIEDFFTREAARFQLALEKPIKVRLAPLLAERLPLPPVNPSLLEHLLWSFKMRYWAWHHDNWPGQTPDIRIYMQFYSIGSLQIPRHSLGMQKGMIGLVNAYASSLYQGQNNLVAAHELLHTVGATDKYDPATTWPVWPDGYAEPTRQPLLPQYKAEIMGGRVQVSPAIALVPPGLEHATIGAATAIEINWLAAKP